MTDVRGSRVGRKVRARAALFLAAAVIAGIAAMFLVKVYLDQARRRAGAAPVATVTVVVAATDLKGGQLLDANNVALVQWPAANVPAGAFQRVEQVVGQTLRQELVASEPVLEKRLASKSLGQGLAAVLDPGARAMGVKVDQVVGIAGFVQPHDRVDVITTIPMDDEMRAALGSKAQKVSKIILQDIRVLAVGEHLSTDGTKPVKVQVVTLEVQPDQSERLALASLYGSIQLTMRSRVDRKSVETDGVTPLALLAVELPPIVETAPPAAKEAAAAPRPKTARRRQRVRELEVAVPTPAAKPAAQQPPVIEILRGTTKVEERKIKVGGAQ